MNLALRVASGGAVDASALPPLPGSLHANRVLSRWLAFRQDGTVAVSPGKVELGQGILTALAAIAADELDVDPDRVVVVPAATPNSPDEAVTSGSLSVQECGAALRHACAEARALHVAAAARCAGLATGGLRVADGTFLAPSGEAVGSYWSAEGAGLLLEREATPMVGGARAKPPAARRVAGVGAGLARLDLPDKVFGRARYLHDLRPPGLLHARVVRPPEPGARLVGIRDGLGAPMPGETRAVRDGDFLAVVAEDEWSAERAAERLAARAGWAEPPQGDAPTLDGPVGLEAWLRSAPADTEVVAERGDPAPPLPPGAAVRAVRRRFLKPYLAHASVGTCCALALWDGARMEVTSHAQGPYNLRADLALALRLPVGAVVVRHAEGAGCYGHNGADDAALEAALVARAVPGRPVRLLWSRAEELAWGPLSPAMLVEVEAAADAATGALLSWHQEARGQGHSTRPGRAPTPTLLAASMIADPFPSPVAVDAPLAAGGGGQRNAVPPYAVPSMRVLKHRVTEAPVRTSALRGLGALANVWAAESVLDELADALGSDPLEYRLRHLARDPRAADALRAVAGMSDWARRRAAPRPEGTGLGLGYARYKNTGAWCAVAAEVDAAGEVVRARRLWVAADLGEVVCPDGAANQIEGGAVQACSLALKEAVRFDGRGRVASTDWDSYPVLRFSEAPAVEARLLARPEEPPLGAGECSLGPTVAALAAAIHDALGVRPRRMPFTAANLAADADEEGAP